MLQRQVNIGHAGSAFSILALIYHSTVRQIRKSHGNALVGLLMNILQSAIFVMVFYFMFSILGLRGAAVRGNFMLYIMTGIFLFITHSKAMGAVVGSDGPASPMMLHAPMNTVISITSAALGALYMQILSAAVILAAYYSLAEPFVIDRPVGAFAMFLVAWASGVGVGMVFLAAKPWFPGLISVLTPLYARANMIASGKMFLANTLPPTMLALFDWNPLFHCIDQARGFVFINYTPHNSSISYPIYVTIALIMIGLMGEFFTRRHISASWSAGR
ncbi:MAG: ABC transporter permease [Paracoccaceae bacterium]